MENINMSEYSYIILVEVSGVVYEKEVKIAEK